MRRLLAVCCLALLATSCGKSKEEQQVEQAQKGAEAVAKGFEDMAKGLQGMTVDPNRKPVDPVNFHDLQAAFGDLKGWEKGTPTGERMTMPVNYSEAKISYTKGDATIDVTISDSAFNQMLITPFSMFLAAGYEKETAEGYEKSMKVGDNPGWEKWNKTDKSGELNAVVNKRFIVQVEGRGLEDSKPLHDLMASTDLKKLAGLK